MLSEQERLCVKSQPRPIGESLHEMMAFGDALDGMIAEFGAKKVLRFIGCLVRDGDIPAINARWLKAEVLKRAMVA
jgi:hypothetical protein